MCTMKIHDLVEYDFPGSKTVQPHEVDDVMYSLWLSFNFYLGLQCNGLPDPTHGYKLETVQAQKDNYLGQAIRMRNKYAALTMRFGRGQDILKKMTDSLSQLDNGLL